MLQAHEDTVVSAHVREVIEKHVSDLEGPPTVEFVERICAELTSPPQRVQALYYFLVESPLGTHDLLGVCRTVSPYAARLVTTQAAHVRDHRLLTDKAPRWKR
jgi:hypothetical protein